MVMRLSLARAKVTTPTGTYEGAVVQTTRDAQLVIREGGTGTELFRSPATAVRPASADRSWEIDTAAGLVTVVREKGCGCGG